MAAKSVKKTKKLQKLDELPGQSDPKASLDSALLLRAAQPVLKALAEDLLERAKTSSAITETLTARHAAERAQERTADPYDVWLRFFTKQVAAAWFLSCVFVRVLEDRGLVEQHRIAGPGAVDSQQLFFELAPSLSERDYLLTVFRELSSLPGAADLFDAKHNPVWLLAPSAERAGQLLQLFRTPNANEPALRFGQADTRFLGDLYQDLDEDVRERFALLQTPHFIESFILDRTLERALERFGLDDTTLIDPTCGSGHFLLGAFERLVDHRLRAEPGLDVREAAQKALNAVYGADINPYAIAIARFRLTLAFLEKAGYRRLADAPKLPLHLAVADSLLHNPQRKLAYQRNLEDAQQTSFGEQQLEDRKDWERSSLYELEDPEAVRDVLYREHAAVVGNPPYITVKDKAQRDLYRSLYASAAAKYSLAAPFTERFFQLARESGYIGAITANSFMKREFGKALIEKCLPDVNVDLVVNTSGAYIPGHGTPTVLLFGTAEAPQSTEVRTVLAKRGEPSTPEIAKDGQVWSSIAKSWNHTGFEDEYISVGFTSRDTLRRHPWSLGGGGAAELKELLEERRAARLSDIVDDIGFASFTGLDDAFIVPHHVIATRGLETAVVRPIVTGEDVRDWCVTPQHSALTPYNKEDQTSITWQPGEMWARFLWPYRTVAKNVASFGGKTRSEEGQDWWLWYRWQAERYRAQFLMTFAFVATHNHFVLDRGGKVFNRSAPIIKLPESATEDDHLALLAYLNSSTACFWMKQVMFQKSSQNYVGDVRDKPERIHYEFAGTQLEKLPIPKLGSGLVMFGKTISDLAEQRASVSPDALLREKQYSSSSQLDEAIVDAKQRYEFTKRRMVALQEELDWYVYDLFELSERRVSEDEPNLDIVGIDPDDRVHIRHGDGDGQDHSNARERALISQTNIRLIEAPLYKRPWFGTQGVFQRDERSFDDLLVDTLRGAAAGAVEDCLSNRRSPAAAPDLFAMGVDSGLLVQKLAELSGISGQDLLRKTLAIECVPFLAAFRHTAQGIEKRIAWERTWELQRHEDRGETGLTIPIPPKYDQKDFRDPNYFRLRGKLDVPKERFISYPGCGSDEDGEPVYGWAGWNHLQQAQALAALYQARKQEGWNAERLTPMLAGLLELLPWLKQWHNEPSAEFDGLRLGDYFEGYLDEQCAELGLTRDGLRAWRPPARGRGAAGAKSKTKAKSRKAKADSPGESH